MKTFEALKPWLTLFGLQSFVSIVLFSEFLSGNSYFAYLDIGSDSYAQAVPYAMYLARSMAQEGFTGWSFQLGLGGPTTAMFGDLASLLVQLVGSESILPTRIFFYILKIVLGGMFFLLFIRYYVKRWESAVISALAYSFCGFMVINGQWDVEATAFVFYPLVLWAIVKSLRTINVWALPIAIATALLFGTFFVSLGVFLIYSCVVFVASGDSYRAALRPWLVKILPLTVIGYLLAAPYLSPVVFQLLDSARVSGEESLIQKLLSQSLGVNDWSYILVQIGGIFHKDIFGIGSAYYPFLMNYLEGPGFFIGVTPLLLFPQLWGGSRSDKKLLLFAVLGFSAYIVFPVFRYAAMGFAAPYFRISTLWVSMAGLVLAAKALDQIFSQGVNARFLAIGLVMVGVLLSLVLYGSVGGLVWSTHAVKICVLAVISTIVLMLAHRKLVAPDRLPLVLMIIVIMGIVVVARPSYVEGRSLGSPKLRTYDDGTIAALKTIRQFDSGVFRIEKDYKSVANADSLAQNYMGIRSYSLHSRGMVDFHMGMGLITPISDDLNFANWLPNVGVRYLLNSLLGVKYFISKNPVQWPGFVEVGRSPSLRIYRNDMVLPFGVIQTHQITKAALANIPTVNTATAETYRDVAMFNAVVVDQITPGYGSPFDMDALMRTESLALQEIYFTPASMLQKTGLQIEQFSSNHIVGRISPTQAGILVFSIPFNAGWTLRVDGKETPMFRANFGMLAAPVVAGHHSVELTFDVPGRSLGWIVFALGLTMLGLLAFLKRRSNRST